MNHTGATSSVPLRIGIAGAGTAGLATAIAFARLGHEVHVFEKHGSLATLGAGLLIQPQGIAALVELGLGAAFLHASVPIVQLLGKNHRHWTLVNIPYRDSEARGISRSALAQILYKEALHAGVTVVFNADVDKVSSEGSTGIAFIDGKPRSFDVLVIANGASSVLPTQAGLAVSSTQYKWGALWGMFDVADWAGERILEQRFETTRKMYGLMPTERVGEKLRLSFFWSLPCNAYAAWKASSLDAWKDELLALWPESAPVVSQIASHDQLAFATYYHAHPARLSKPPLCIVGDAAHAMSPQLGLGSTLAVQDALLLARSVAAHGPEQGLLTFSKKRLRTVRTYQGLSWLLTPCFQADGTGLWRDVLFAGGLRIPGVPQLMYRSIAEPRAKNKVSPLLAAETPPPAI